MKNIFKISIILTTIFLVSSCDDGFNELNQDPNNPTVIPASNLITAQQRSIANTLYSTFIGADMGGCWSQHWAKVQYNDEAMYVPRRTSIDDIWDGFYTNVIADADDMYTIAEQDENQVLQGIALTIKAYGFGVITDMYGDVPSEEAIKGATEGVLTPAYSKQSKVYESIDSMLVSAISLIATGNGEVATANDIIYAGNTSNWLAFAKSLRFRSLMRISNKVDVKAKLASLYTSGGMISSNDQNASFKYLGADPDANPLYESIVDGNRGEYKVNEKVIEELNILSDPRLAVYAQPNTDGEYRGKPSGIANVPNDDYNYDNVSPLGTRFLEATYEGTLLSYSELELLIAEAINKGFISGDAEAHYLAGIKASFDENGVSSDYDAYVVSPAVEYSTNTEVALRRIYLQKWLALYGQGIESWTEWRRSISSTFTKGIPELDPALESTLGQVPYRYTYPYLEQSLNKENYDAAVAEQGADVLTTKVWWMN